VVEQLNATSGIGYMVTLARNYAQTDVMLVGLVVYALLGFGTDSAIRWGERRLLAWRRTLGR
jgi:sulfonate transport system permease protein